MSKPRISVQEAALTLTTEILRSSAQATEQIGEQLLPSESFLKRVFSTKHRAAEQSEVLKLNCNVVFPHIAVLEYSIEHENYWNRPNSDLVDSIRHLSFQSISEAFESAGLSTIDFNDFVKEKTERSAVNANMEHEAYGLKIDELLSHIGPSRIARYKEIWGQDDERMFQPGFIAGLPQEVYRHWRGEVPRDWGAIQFNLLLSTSLTGLESVTTRFCCDVEVG